MNKNLSDDQLQTFRYTLVFVQYLVPFCVISFVYIQMAVHLWGTRAPGNAQDSRDITLLKNKKKVSSGWRWGKIRSPFNFLSRSAP